MLARRRLVAANDALAAAHHTPQPVESPDRWSDFIQRAQEHVITIEQEIALLTNGLEREYPDAESDYASAEPTSAP